LELANLAPNTQDLRVVLMEEDLRELVRILSHFTEIWQTLDGSGMVRETKVSCCEYPTGQTFWHLTAKQAELLAEIRDDQQSSTQLSRLRSGTW